MNPSPALRDWLGKVAVYAKVLAVLLLLLRLFLREIFRVFSGSVTRVEIT
jgi:hypothetical protein